MEGTIKNRGDAINAGFTVGFRSGGPSRRRPKNALKNAAPGHWQTSELKVFDRAWCAGWWGKFSDLNKCLKLVYYLCYYSEGLAAVQIWDLSWLIYSLGVAVVG